MARGVNKVILVGNLGADPEIRYMNNSDVVASIRLATSESWVDKQSGERQERTEWHSVVFFRRLAEVVGEYLRKGGKVYVEGKLQTRKWQDKEGNDRYTTQIIADEMHMLDSKQNGSDVDGYPRNSQQRNPTFGNNGKQHQPQPTPVDFDDEIPF